LTLALAALATACGSVDTTTEPEAARPRHWSAPQRLGDTGSRVEHPCGAKDMCAPQVATTLAVGPQGHAVAAWSEADDDGRYFVRAARFVPSQGWLPSTRVPGDVPDSTRALPRIGVDANGNAIAVWTESRLRGDDGGNGIVAMRFDGAAWSATQAIDPGGHWPSQPDLLVEPSGDATAVWNDGVRCWVFSARFVAGRWEGPQLLSPGPQDPNRSGCFDGAFMSTDARVLAAVDGTALVEWHDHRGARGHWRPTVFWTRRAPGGGWRPAEDVTERLAHSVRTAADDKGNVIGVGLSSTDNAGAIEARQFRVTGGWQAPVPLASCTGTPCSPPGHDSQLWDSPTVAMSAGGVAVATWIEFGGRTHYPVWTSLYAPASGWGAPKRLTNFPSYATLHAISVLPMDDGRVLAVWETSERIGESVLWSSQLEPASDWGPAARVASSTQALSRTTAKLDARGNAIVIWTEEPRDAQGRTKGPVTLWASRFAAD